MSTFFHDTKLLYNSLSSPWGAVTSIFIYDGWQNAFSYFFLVFLALCSNAAYLRDRRTRRFQVMIASAFLGAIVGNFVQLILWTATFPTGYSLGQSGVVYAFWGSFSCFLLFDVIFTIANLIQKGRNKRPIAGAPVFHGRLRRRLTSTIVLLIAFTLTVGYLVLDPSGFFSAGPGVDSGLHALAYIFGVITTFVIWSFYILRRHKTV